MDFMMNGELKFLKKTASEEECDLANELKTDAMEGKKNEYLAENPVAKVEGESVSPIADDEPAAVEDEEDDDDDDDESIDEDSEEQADEDAALQEAADAVKAAMRATEN